MSHMEWRPTACVLCSENCGTEVQIDGRHLARIKGDHADPSSRGYLCDKASHLDYYQNRRDRLTKPLGIGNLVGCESSTGAVLATAQVDDTVQPGAVSLPHGFGLEYKNIPVRVSKATTTPA